MSYGVSGVPKKIIRNASNVLALPFQRLSNVSVDTETFPNAFKEFSVVVIHKRDSKEDKANYRQFCMIDPLSSAIEGIVNEHLLDYLIKNKYIPEA